MNSLLMTMSLIARMHSIEPAMLSSVCYHESTFDPYVIVRDDGGSPSYGLCQVKLETARMLGFRGTADELMDPQENMHYAAKYLSKQLSRYNGDVNKAVSGYNAGTATSKNFKYVKKVSHTMKEHRKVHGTLVMEAKWGK